MIFDPATVPEAILNCTEKLNGTDYMMEVHDLHQIINGIFCVLSFSAFTLNTVILYAYTRCNDFHLNTPVGIGILFFSSVVTIVADLSYNSTDDLQYNIYTTALQSVFGIGVFIVCSLTLFTIPTDGRENALGYHHENIGLIILFITVPLVLFELFLFLDNCIHPYPSMIILDIVSMLQKVVQAGFYHFSLRFQTPEPNKTRAASWFLKIAALLNLSMWLQSIMTADEQSEHMLLNTVTKSLKPRSIIACTYSAFIIDYRLLCCLLFLEHALEIDYASPGEHPFTPQPTQVDNMNAQDLHLSVWRFKGLGFLVGLGVFILTIVNGAQYFTSIGSWTDSFSFFIEILVIIFGIAMVKQISNKPNNNIPSPWRETSSIGIDVMVSIMGIIGITYWALKGCIIAIWYIKVPDASLYQEFNTEGLTHLEPSYLGWQAFKCFVRAIGVLFQIYFFVNINGSFGRCRKIFSNPWNSFYVPAMMVSLFSIFLNSVIDSYGGFVERNVKKARFSTVVSALYHAGAPIHLGFCIHLFLHFVIIQRRLDKAVEQVLDQTSVLRRRNLTRSSTSILEEPRVSFLHGDDADDKTKNLIRPGRKNFFKTH